MVTEELLEEFKEKMVITHKSQDRDLKRSLSFSIAYVEDTCGKFDINGDKNTDKRAKELVFERARYDYNEALEFFEDNFLSEITSLGIDMAGDDDEEI